MRLVILILALIGFGCATKTVHEVCSNPLTLSRFKDYDQCYAEVSAERARTPQRNIIQDFSDGYNNTRKSQPQETHCITNGSTFGDSYSGTTNCY